MIAKTMIVWRGPEETDDSRGAAITFSTNALDIRHGTTDTPQVYYLSNARGEVVAEITIRQGAHAREV